MNVQSISNISFTGLNAQKIGKTASKLSNTMSDSLSASNNTKLAKLLPLALAPLAVNVISNKKDKSNKNEELPFVETPIVANYTNSSKTQAELEKNAKEWSDIASRKKENEAAIRNAGKTVEAGDIDSHGYLTCQGKDKVNFRGGNIEALSSGNDVSSLPPSLEEAFDAAGDIQTAGGIVHNAKRVIEGIENNDKRELAKGAVGLVDNTLGVGAREATIAAATGVAASIGGTIGGFVEGALTNGTSTKNGEKIGAAIAATATQAVARIEWGKVRDKVVDKVTDYIESPEGQEKISEIKEFGKEVLDDTKKTIKNVKEDTKEILKEIKESELYNDAKEKVKEAGSKFLKGLSSFFND